jgi:hypothetical protein
VVFAALAPLAGLACKGRWGGLKEAQGGRCFCLQCLSRWSFYKQGFSLPHLALSTFRLSRLQLPKTWGKIFGGRKNFAL